MSARISYRSVLISILLTVIFFTLTVFSFAQELDNTDSTTSVVTDTKPLRGTNLLKSARQSTIESIQEKRAIAMERAKGAKEEFREKAQEIKDERKRSALLRIGDSLSTINTRLNTKWAGVLDKMSDILDRISNKADEADDEGDGVTEINTLIDTAREAIVTAITAIEAQSEKEYTIEIGDEETLGGSVSAVVQEFKQDLRTVHTQIRNARDAVRQAARGLAQLKTNDADEIEDLNQNTVTP